jgi:hypothetical protein
MARLFSSIRIAPGVRLSTSGQGLRAHVGPRSMRMHAGGGRTGVSTGAGPFTAYQSIGGASRPRSSNQSKAEHNAQRHEVTAKTLAAIHAMHRANFPVAQRELAVPPKLPKFQRLLLTAEKEKLHGVGKFDREARRTAKGAARDLAETWAIDLLGIANHETASAQAQMDKAWNDLMANDASAVSEAVAQAFRASDAPAVFVSCESGVAEIVVDGPLDADLPTLKPTLTARGAKSVGNLNKTERAAVLRQIFGSKVLLVAKQAFAAAPALEAVRVLGRLPAETGGSEVVLAVTLPSGRIAGANFGADAWSVLNAVDPGLVAKLAGRTGELRPINLSREPSYQGLLARHG